MMALGIAAFFYIVVALLFCLVICRRYSKAQSAVELIIILLTPGGGGTFGLAVSSCGDTPVSFGKRRSRIYARGGEPIFLARPRL